MPRGFEPVQLTTQNCSLRLRWLDRLSKAGSERRNSRPRGPNKVGGPSRSTRVRAIRHTPRNFRKLAAALWRTHPVGASNRSVRLVLASLDRPVGASVNSALIRFSCAKFAARFPGLQPNAQLAITFSSSFRFSRLSSEDVKPAWSRGFCYQPGFRQAGPLNPIRNRSESTRWLH